MTRSGRIPKPGSVSEAHPPVSIPGPIPTLHPQDVLPPSSLRPAYLLCPVAGVPPVELTQRRDTSGRQLHIGVVYEDVSKGL